MKECGQALRRDRILVECGYFSDEDESGDRMTTIVEALVSDFGNSALAVDLLSSDSTPPLVEHPDESPSLCPLCREPADTVGHTDAGRAIVFCDKCTPARPEDLLADR